MRKRIWYLFLTACGIAVIAAAIVPTRRSSSLPATPPDPTPYEERAPTTPWRSISPTMFSRQIKDGTEHITEDLGDLAAITLSLLSDSGDILPSLHSEGGDDFSFFLSIWNHTDQLQSMGVVPFVDYQLTDVLIDDAEETHLYKFQLQPNESIEIPVTLRGQPLPVGLHELTLLVVRRPDAYAFEDPLAQALCCFVSRHTIHVGPGATPPQESEGEEVSFSLDISQPSIQDGKVEITADSPFTIHPDVTASTPWKLITLVDYQQVVKNLSGGAEEPSGTAALASLPPGRHEVLSILLLDPIDPSGFSKFDPTNSGHAAIRYTIVAQ